MLAFNLCEKSGIATLTLYYEGKSYVVNNSNPNWNKIKDLLYEHHSVGGSEEIAKEIVSLINIKKAVEVKSGGKVTIGNDDIVYYGDKPLHNSMTERLINTMNDGWPIDHLITFIENLMNNSSYRVVQELGDFLTNKNLPITTRGTFLGYKKVRSDYYDYYSGKFDNSIGQIVEIPCNLVDDNRDHTCSVGLHVGGLEYAANQYHPNEGKIIVVEVDPKDCVSVPKDYNAQKLRVSKYIVVEDYTGPLPDSVYDNNAVPNVYDGDDEDYVPEYVQDNYQSNNNLYYNSPGW